jgi:hypothetical protein
MKGNLMQALLCCAFVICTVDLWSSLFPWLLTVKFCCSIRLRRAVPLLRPLWDDRVLHGSKRTDFKMKLI